jgi:gentisate 1,2-dioxygenase
MQSVTRTQVSHYDVQKKRRREHLDEWRRNRKGVIRRADVQLADSPLRRMKRGVYVGADGQRPSKVLDATLHEIAPGETSTVHRHSWDAVMFVESGRGWTEIEGERIPWRSWDTLHIPSWAWHRHGNDGEKPASFHTWSVEPMLETFGVALLEEGGDLPHSELPPPPRQSAERAGDDPYARRLRRLAERSARSKTARLITRFEDVRGVVSPRGARSLFLVDSSMGYETAGLSAVMHELAPGLYQARHRHGGEALLYVVSGKGHTEIDGVDHPWESGDLVVVDHWCWHQHFNDDDKHSARLIRVHNSDALYDMMRVLLDPLVISEELPELDAPDLSGIAWPDHLEGRPE